MGGENILPKKSSISVKHQVKKKQEKDRTEDIEVEIFKMVSNPHSVNFCKLYMPIQPQPTSNLENEIAKWSASQSRHVRYEKWDLSRPDEAPYSRKEYMLVAETTQSENIDLLKQEINTVEENYRSKLAEISKKISKPPDILVALSI